MFKQTAESYYNIFNTQRQKQHYGQAIAGEKQDAETHTVMHKC
jgi:hypothetical protein